MGTVPKVHMKARIVRTGKSQGIRLPKALLKKVKLRDVVEVLVEPGQILISNTGKPRVGWVQAAQRMRARGEHRSLDAAIPTRFDTEDW